MDIDKQEIKDQPLQQEQQPNEQEKDQNIQVEIQMKEIEEKLKYIDFQQIKELRRLLRLDNLQNVEEISTLDYLMYVINSNSMRNALQKLKSQYKMMYRTLGDGNCFYRSLMLNKVFWLVEQKNCQPLEDFIKKIYNMQAVNTIFQEIPMDAKHLKSIYLFFLFKILEEKRKGNQIKMLDIIRYYNAQPEVDFSSVVICRQLINDTYNSFKEHAAFKDFLDDDMKEKIDYVLLRYFYEAQYVIIPLAAQTFQCELNIQNFYKPDEYSSKVNIEKLNYSPLEVEDKDAQQANFNLLYNGGHYELIVSEEQAKSDFYSLNNKMVLGFNTKFSEKQYFYFTQNFIARYQTEIIRMNNIEESAFFKQQNNGEGGDYQTEDWQNLQRSDEYRRQIQENQKLKQLIENLKYQTDIKEDPKNNNNQVKQPASSENRSSSNSNSTQSSQRMQNSKQMDGDNSNSIDCEQEENVKANQVQNKQINNNTNFQGNNSNHNDGNGVHLKQTHSNQYDEVHSNQQNLYQSFKKSNSCIQQNQGDVDMNNGANEDQNQIDYQSLKKICTSCTQKLPDDFKYPFYILPMDDEIPEDVVLKICVDCFIQYAKTIQVDQEFLELNGKLYQLTPRIMEQFRKFNSQQN